MLKKIITKLMCLLVGHYWTARYQYKPQRMESRKHLVIARCRCCGKRYGYELQNRSQATQCANKINRTHSLPEGFEEIGEAGIAYEKRCRKEEQRNAT